MNKLLLVVLCCSVAVIGLFSLASAQYVIGQLNSSPGEDYVGGINVSGRVVWYGFDGTDNEIFLYDGTTVLQLTDNAYDDFDPKINGSGHVAWSGFDGNDYEIFLYDGTQAIQLTDNTFNDYVFGINASSQVVWVGHDGNDYEIFLYTGTLPATQITDNALYDHDPQVNDASHVVWNGSDGDNYEIFLYDGLETKRITDNAYDDRMPQINASDHVVWQGSDGNNAEIFLYDGSEVFQLSDNDYGDVSPRINDNGYVAWSGGSGGSSNIYLYDGISTTPLTNAGWHGHPQINSSGHVAWFGTNEGGNGDIFLYDGATVKQITKTAHGESHPCINESDEMAWYGTDTYDIFLATKSDKPVVLRMPNGGQVFSPGEETTLAWAAVPRATSFKVLYSLDNALTWKPINGERLATTVIDSWTIPRVTKNKTKCLVKVVGLNKKGDKVGSDRSDGPFTIEVLTITDINEGEACDAGQPCPITWELADAITPDTLQISYTLDGGTTWKKEAAIPMPPGSTYDWTAPNVGRDRVCKLKLTFKATGETVATATSTKFTVNAP